MAMGATRELSLPNQQYWRAISMTDFSNSDPELNSSRHEQLPKRLPPVRIWDLMVLTTSMAVVYLLQGWLSDFQPELNSDAWNIMRLISSVPSGIALASVYWIVNQKCLTGKFFLQPGHWVLASQAVLMLQTIVAVLLLASSAEDIFQAGAWVRATLISFGLIHLLASLILVGGLRFGSIRWRLVLGATALIYASESLIYLSQAAPFQFAFTTVVAFVSPFEFVASICGILFLVVAVMIDIRTRTRRDWLHWAGVAVLIFESVITPIVQWIFIRYFFIPG